MIFIQDLKRYKTLDSSYKLLWHILDQSFWVLASYRILNFLYVSRVTYLAKFLEKISEFIFKCYIPSNTSIGEGLVIYHAFNIIINGKCIIGKNCTLYSSICIGQRFPGDAVPKIGDNVVIGTGACILGGIAIPSDTIIPANSVVTEKTLNEFT